MLDINTEKYLIFSIFDKKFSFPSKYISEVTLFDTVYPLPLMPDFIPGVINRYSVPYALFDIGLLLFNKEGRRSKALVLKDDIDRIAFLIDDVCGTADLTEDKLLNIDHGRETGELADLVLTSFVWENEDVFILDVRQIISRAGIGAE
jgi:purine-binding chemotaxis protein CheW